MSPQISPSAAPPQPLAQAFTVPHGGRWQVHQRLQELDIASLCNPDGSLQVEVQTPLQLLIVRSTFWQLTADRCTLVDWLERCWLAG